MENTVGRVSQVLGAVVDVTFDGELPANLGRFEDNGWRSSGCPRSRSALG